MSVNHYFCAHDGSPPYELKTSLNIGLREGRMSALSDPLFVERFSGIILPNISLPSLGSGAPLRVIVMLHVHRCANTRGFAPRNITRSHEAHSFSSTQFYSLALARVQTGWRSLALRPGGGGKAAKQPDPSSGSAAATRTANS